MDDTLIDGNPLHQYEDLEYVRTLPEDWRKEQMDFMHSLKPEDLALMMYYTTTPGYTVINAALRGNVQMPSQESGDFLGQRMKYLWKPERAPEPHDRLQNPGHIPNFVNKFMSIASKAPVLKEKLHVWRGVKRREDINLHGNEILSTTYRPDNPKRLGFAGPECCVLDITVEPGVRAVWIKPFSHAPMEAEIMIIPPFKIVATEVSPGKFTAVVSPAPRSGGSSLWPPKYYRGLSTRRKSQRHREITRRKKMSWKDQKAYKPFKTDKGTRRRPSSYSSRFHTKYPGVKSLPEIAKATGVSGKTLRKVYNRGMAAWRTGHRPGATPQAWGMARVHSFVLHGKTWRTADADLSHKK